MEDKKLNELKDEALDAVTGGAYFQRNEETGKWDVFDKRGKLIGTYDRQLEAKRKADDASLKERYGDGPKWC